MGKSVAGRHEEHVFVKLFHLAGQILLVFSQTLVDDFVQFRLLKGLGQVIMRSQADGLHHFAGIANAGQHDYLHARKNLAHLLQSLQAVNSGHEQIHEDYIRL